MVSRSWSGVVPVAEGCPGVVSRCPSGMFPVEGSCCGDIRQDPAVSGEPLDFWDPRPLSFPPTLPGRLRCVPVVVVRVACAGVLSQNEIKR